MKDREYIQTQEKIILLTNFLNGVPDLGEFILRINQAEAVAPIIDPTLYMKASDNLQFLKGLAIRFKKVQEFVEDNKIKFTKKDSEWIEEGRSV